MGITGTNETKLEGVRQAVFGQAEPAQISISDIASPEVVDEFLAVMACSCFKSGPFIIFG